MERVGSFELLGRLGAGGMAEVFAARRVGPGGFEQRVCVKRIRASAESDPRFVRMFLEEARIAARLRHATIVQVLEVGEERGVPFLALELVDGLDLRRLIDGLRARGDRLSAEDVAQLASDLSTALEVAHRGGVLHRDVSPGNVLVSVFGEVKLADFGIATASDSERWTATGVPKGKVAYFAPEYALTGEATERTDLYALGVTLYQAATGERPFHARTELGTLLRARDGDRAKAGDRAAHLPRGLAEAIDRLIEPTPEARFASASELFDALERVMPRPGARRRLGARVRSLRAAATEPTRSVVDAGSTPITDAGLHDAATFVLREPRR
jgi:serine/threonine protein kinase